MNERREKIFKFIVDYISENSYGPTLREIGLELEIKSTSAISYHLKALERDGKINIGKGGNRTIQLSDQISFKQIPIIGSVAAGEPILAESYYDDHFPIPSMMGMGKDVFALNVQGDSMIDVGINSGDLAIIERRETANIGEIVLAYIDGEATIKRFVRDGDGYALKPENKKYNLIKDHFKIMGKLVGVYKMF